MGHVVSEETKKKMSVSQKGKQLHKNNANWKGGRTKIKDGYIIICLLPNDPYISMCSGRGHCVGEHRYIMAKQLGRPLKSYEFVHHVNGIKDDNRIENLIVIDAKEHSGFHLIVTRMEQRIKELEKLTISLS